VTTRAALAVGLLLGLQLGWSPLALTQAKDGATISSLTLFAGTATGLWRSNDWGTTWLRVKGKGAGESLEAIGAVTCIAPLGPQVYVGAASGIYLSLDFGDTWRRVSEQSGCTVLMPSRFPLADPTLFVATRAGLLRSGLERFEKPEDSARLFGPTALKDAEVNDLAWPGPALIAATSRGVQISSDAGEHFEAMRGALPQGSVTALAASSYYATDPALFVAVGTSGVFRSADGGERWSSAGLAGNVIHQLVWLGPLLYAATEAGLSRSDDLGASWAPLNKGLEKRPGFRLLFPLAPESGAEAFLGTDRGLFWTGDGGQNWTPSGLALREEAVLALGTFPAPDRTVNVKKRR